MDNDLTCYITNVSWKGTYLVKPDSTAGFRFIDSSLYLKALKHNHNRCTFKDKYELIKVVSLRMFSYVCIVYNST